MAKNKQKGDFGELQARAYLRSCGYEILAVNWRYKHLEADIIMRDNEVLVFVEVKTRSSRRFGYPEEAVNYAKQRNLIRLARIYLAKHAHPGDIRFDIVAVVPEPTIEIEHIKDAFWPY